jgi:hypothetical protein
VRALGGLGRSLVLVILVILILVILVFGVVLTEIDLVI